MKVEKVETSRFSQAGEAIEKEALNIEKLLLELQKRNLTSEVIEAINTKIKAINQLPLTATPSQVVRNLKHKKMNIIKAVEKELKIVPKNYYRNIWMVLGMSAFGIPLGMFISIFADNWAFLGIGIPIGMVIGMGYGTTLDKKAAAENRQLDLEYNE